MKQQESTYTTGKQKQVMVEETKFQAKIKNKVLTKERRKKMEKQEPLQYDARLIDLQRTILQEYNKQQRSKHLRNRNQLLHRNSKI